MDIQIRLPQALTGDDEREILINLVESATEEGVFSWDITRSLELAGIALSDDIAITNGKLDDLIEAVQALGGAVSYITLIDETTTTNMTYIGKALLTGGAVSEAGAHWQVKRIDETGAVTKIKYADGDTLFDNIWNDRVSLTYA